MFGSGLGPTVMVFQFSFEHAVFFKITYFRFRSVNRKSRNDRYIDGTMNPAPLGHQDRIKIGARTTKLLRIRGFFCCSNSIALGIAHYG
jgi:hypothetical protein